MNLGIKIGYGNNFCELTPNHIEDDTFKGFPSNSDYTIGIQLDNRFTIQHVLRSSISFVQFGYKQDSYFDPYYGPIRNSYEIKAYSINAQVEYQYHFLTKEKLSYFINSGINMGLPIAGSQKTIYQDGSSETNSLNSMSAFNIPNYSILIGIGTTFKTKSSFNWELNPYFQYQLNDRYTNLKTTNPFSIGLMLSFNYFLKDKTSPNKK